MKTATKYVIRCFAACPNTLFTPKNSLLMSRLFDGGCSVEDYDRCNLHLLRSYWKCVDIPILETQATHHPADLFRLLLEKKMSGLINSILESRAQRHIDSFVSDLCCYTIGFSGQYLTCFQVRRIEMMEGAQAGPETKDYPASKLVWCVPMVSVSEQDLVSMYNKAKRIIEESNRVFRESISSYANDRGKFSINDRRRAGGWAEDYIAKEISRNRMNFTPDSLAMFSDLTPEDILNFCGTGEAYQIFHLYEGWGRPSGFVVIEPEKTMVLHDAKIVVDEFRVRAESFLVENSLTPKA